MFLKNAILVNDWINVLKDLPAVLFRLSLYSLVYDVGFLLFEIFSPNNHIIESLNTKNKYHRNLTPKHLNLRLFGSFDLILEVFRSFSVSFDLHLLLPRSLNWFVHNKRSSKWSNSEIVTGFYRLIKRN